jgi:hypothetical protein
MAILMRRTLVVTSAPIFSSYDIVAVAGKQSQWTRRRRIDLAELVNEPWTLPAHDTGIGAFSTRRSAHAGWNRHAQPSSPTPCICGQAPGNGSVSHDAFKLHIDVAGQASLAQGIACRLSQCTWDDRHHHVEEPNAQSAGGAIREYHPCCS